MKRSSLRCEGCSSSAAAGLLDVVDPGSSRLGKPIVHLRATIADPHNRPPPAPLAEKLSVSSRTSSPELTRASCALLELGCGKLAMDNMGLG